MRRPTSFSCHAGVIGADNRSDTNSARNWQKREGAFPTNGLDGLDTAVCSFAHSRMNSQKGGSLHLGCRRRGSVCVWEAVVLGRGDGEGARMGAWYAPKASSPPKLFCCRSEERNLISCSASHLNLLFQRLHFGAALVWADLLTLSGLTVTSRWLSLSLLSLLAFSSLSSLSRSA